MGGGHAVDRMRDLEIFVGGGCQLELKKFGPFFIGAYQYSYGKL